MRRHHDLGKAADEEYEDSHAIVGAKIKQHGEMRAWSISRRAPPKMAEALMPDL